MDLHVVLDRIALHYYTIAKPVSPWPLSSLRAQSPAGPQHQRVQSERLRLRHPPHHHLQLSSGSLCHHAGVQDVLGQLAPPLRWEPQGQALSQKATVAHLEPHAIKVQRVCLRVENGAV